MKKILALLFFASITTVGYSQSYARFIDRLTAPGGNATVSVTLDRQSGAALSQSTQSSTIYGFRICLYSGSDQNARSMASGAVGRLKNEFPAIPSKMEYESPVFKVFAGACLTRAEAAILLATLRGSFPAAFIKADRLRIDELTASSTAEVVDTIVLEGGSTISDF